MYSVTDKFSLKKYLTFNGNEIVCTLPFFCSC